MSRTDLERENGQYIDGFVHIPVDELRERVGELDKSKPVYIHCRTGLRSYVACCMLAGLGFDCYNLSGGWRLYESDPQRDQVPGARLLRPQLSFPALL